MLLECILYVGVHTSCRIKGASVAKTGKRVIAYPDDQGSITTLTRDDGRACA